MANALDVAISGLKVAQRSLDVVSANVSNASTVGYSRKILPQSASVISGDVSGVLSGTVYRNVNKNLIVAEQDQTSTAGYYNTKANYISSIIDFHGSSESGKSISSKIGTLEESFINLSSDPSSTENLTTVLSSAQAVADEFNNYSEMLNELRNQTEQDISAAVNAINTELATIAKLNAEIVKLATSNSSIAELEDLRDASVKAISEYIDVNTYYEGEKLVLITKRGTTLVDSFAHELSFNQGNSTSSHYYPDSLSGLYIDGEDVSQQNLGGALDALFELRDEDIPIYQAQIDELAQKLSERFAAEGLQLFNNQYGDVPTSTTSPAATGYVGYAAIIQVNENIIDNPDLLRNGTSGNVEATGSTEVISRVIKYTFGTYSTQQAQGNVDISGMVNLSTTLSMITNNNIAGNTAIASYSSFEFLTNAADLQPAGADFDITLEGQPAVTITVLETDTASSLVTKINTALGSNVASLSSSGYLVFKYQGDITFAANAAGPSTNALSAGVFADLGYTFGTKAAPNPSFSVQLGTRNAVNIEIAATDGTTELLAKLNAIDGLSATLDADGYLVITPDEGGDLTLLNVEGTPLTSLGVIVNNIKHTAFRSDNVGPNAAEGLSTGLVSRDSLSEYVSSIISNQAQEASLLESRAEEEQTYLETLETKNSDISGVNLDEEMSELIRIQANYSAAAQMISNIIKMYDTLLAAFD